MRRSALGVALVVPGVLGALAGTAFGQGMPLVRLIDAQGHECTVEGCGKAGMLMMRAAQQRAIADGDPSQVSPFGEREALTATDLLTVDLDIEINPTSPNIAGSNEMRVRSLQNGLTQFTFMLRSQYVISQLLVDGQNNALPSAPPANSYARTVTLPRAYNVGEEFTVKVFYSGTPVSRGFGSIEFQTNGNGDPVVATLSEAYYAATWWPTKDGDVFLAGDNSDKYTGRIAITAPDNLETVANGVLEGVDTIPGGKKRYRWVTNYPTATYLWAFCTTNYDQWTVPYNYPLPGGGTGTMPVEFSMYAGGDTPANRNAANLIVQMLATFRGVYGEYPFINEKYGVYQFPFGGGMEHQTYSGQSDLGESLSAHELAHQWWGDNVTNKTWNHIWLNEGFATYSECIWQERKPGSTGLAALRTAINSRRPNPTTDTVFVSDASNMNRIFSSNYSYRKGAWVLHQLRGVIGDTAFFSGLQAYRAAYQGSAATTENFRDVMSAVSGRNLNNFFEQWVYDIGHPQYAFGYSNVTINGQPFAKVSLRQTQNTAWGLAGGVFEMPVQMRLNTASGNVTRTLENTARTQHFLVPVPASVTGAVMDEFDWILTDSKVSEAYQAGPGKIAATLPAPGAAIALNQSPSQVRVFFSEAMNASAGAFTVSGPSGNVAFALGNAGSPTTSTLTFSSPLAAGTYTVTVAPSVVTTTGAIALDGEITGGLLPSGNGLAGGAASFSFTVVGAGCDSIDFNNDGSFFDPVDIDAFLSVFSEGPCVPSGATCNDIDFNNDNSLFDPCDIESFLLVFSEGPCTGCGQ